MPYYGNENMERVHNSIVYELNDIENMPLEDLITIFMDILQDKIEEVAEHEKNRTVMCPVCGNTIKVDQQS